MIKLDYYELNLPDEPDRIWFTSDWHLQHKNIIKYDKRPFAGVRDMDEAIILNMAKLSESDHLIICGDLTFSKRWPLIKAYLDRISARMYFLFGNHDQFVRRNWKEISPYFEKVWGPYADITSGANRIIASHYPIYEWDKGHRGSYHVFGHTHGGGDKANPRINNKCINVAVNLHDYKPVSLSQIQGKFSNRSNITHH